MAFTHCLETLWHVDKFLWVLGKMFSEWHLVLSIGQVPLLLVNSEFSVMVYLPYEVSYYVIDSHELVCLSSRTVRFPILACFVCTICFLCKGSADQLCSHAYYFSIMKLHQFLRNFLEKEQERAIRLNVLCSRRCQFMVCSLFIAITSDFHEATSGRCTHYGWFFLPVSLLLSSLGQKLFHSSHILARF